MNIMATAKREGGLYYTADGRAVDANGVEIKGAPKQPKNTPPEEIARAAASKDPVQRLADTLDRTFGGAAHAAAIAAVAGAPAAAADEDPGTSDSDEEEGLPPIAEMQDHLAGVTDVDELKAMRRKDKRKGAKPLYEARLAELSG